MIVTKTKAELMLEIQEGVFELERMQKDLKKLLGFFDLRSSIPFGEIRDWGKFELTIRVIVDEVSIKNWDATMSQIKELISKYQEKRRMQFELQSQLNLVIKQNEVIENVRIV